VTARTHALAVTLRFPHQFALHALTVCCVENFDVVQAAMDVAQIQSEQDDTDLESALIETAECFENSQLNEEQSTRGTQEMMESAVECCSNQNFGDQSFDLFDSQQLMEPPSLISSTTQTLILN
jgi:hypothetical protein